MEAVLHTSQIVLLLFFCFSEHLWSSGYDVHAEGHQVDPGQVYIIQQNVIPHQQTNDKPYTLACPFTRTGHAGA